MVYDRRSADKVGPLVRWARARVARDPALRRLSVDGQVAELSRLMPDNLIGRHAAQHIRWGLEADLRRAEWRVRSIRTDDADLAEMVGEVRRVLEFGRHRELNDTLRALVRAEQDEPAPTRWGLTSAPPATLRLLAGAHDVEDFAAAHHRRRPVRRAVSWLLR